jgi:hypothetical protein
MSVVQFLSAVITELNLLYLTWSCLVTSSLDRLLMLGVPILVEFALLSVR